jgi:hypothetical protein
MSDDARRDQADIGSCDRGGKRNQAMKWKRATMRDGTLLLVVRSNDNVSFIGPFESVEQAGHYLLNHYPLDFDISIIEIDKYRPHANGKGFRLRFKKSQLEECLGTKV